MNMDWSTWMDAAAPDLIVAAVSGVIALTVGSAITLLWSFRQKSRELDLETAREFHAHYGAFFSVWKMWNRHVENEIESQQIEQEVFERAASAEGGMEAILSRIASHRRLSREMVEDLACFRQGFQSLRQAIRDRRKLEWWSSDVAEYRRFKELSSRVSRIILSRPFVSPFRAVAPEAAWAEITANRWEGTWASAHNNSLQARRP